MSITALQQAKAALRKELKQRLAAMTDQERQRQSDVIAERVGNIKITKNAFNSWAEQ